MDTLENNVNNLASQPWHLDKYLLGTLHLYDPFVKKMATFIHINVQNKFQVFSSEMSSTLPREGF